MQIEHVMQVVPIDPNFEATLQALKAQGWEPVPGVVPVAVYHLIRVAQQPQAESVQMPRGILKIDESKIGIMRNGKMLGEGE